MPKVFTPVSFGKYASSLVVKLLSFLRFRRYTFHHLFGRFSAPYLLRVSCWFLSCCLVGAGYPSGGVHAHPGLTFLLPHLGFLRCHYGASLIVAHYRY